MVPPQMSAISASRSKVTCQAPSCLLPDALLTVMAYVAPEFHWLRIAAVALRPPDATDGDDEAEADDFFPLPAPAPEEAFDEPEDVPDAAWSTKSVSLRLVLTSQIALGVRSSPVHPEVAVTDGLKNAAVSALFDSAHAA